MNDKIEGVSSALICGVASSQNLCMGCQRALTLKDKPKLSAVEAAELAELKKEYVLCRRKVDERRKLGDKWDKGSDRDYWRMRELSWSLHVFGRVKGVWVWDDVFD